MAQRTGRIFTYDEALALFPLVRDRTASAVQELEALASDSATRESESEEEHEELETASREVVARWAAEIGELGCQVKGLWLVDWDAGDGYYCWRHPEPALAHFHGYDEGFAGRIPIT
jgi:hypothetical protein